MRLVLPGTVSDGGTAERTSFLRQALLYILYIVTYYTNNGNISSSFQTTFFLVGTTISIIFLAFSRPTTHLKSTGKNEVRQKLSRTAVVGVCTYDRAIVLLNLLYKIVYCRHCCTAAAYLISSGLSKSFFWGLRQIRVHTPIFAPKRGTPRKQLNEATVPPGRPLFLVVMSRPL